MYKRFFDFLTNEFKDLPITNEVNDFKEELIGSLMDKAEELNKKGNNTEDEIFEKCINSIDGYQETLKELRGKPLVLRDVRKAAQYVLGAIIYFLILASVFLAVSFSMDNWSRTWLIMVEGSFLFVIIVLLYLLINNIINKKTALARTNLPFILSLLIIGAYLPLSFFYLSWSKSWLLFLSLPILIVLGDMILAGISKHKKCVMVELLFIIMFICIVC